MRVPAIAYWPGVIAGGRQSDGVFDLMDLFATTATLAGVPAAIPHDRYIDSVDQTGFLLADKGLSTRKFLYLWMQETFSGLRVAEHKMMVAGTYWEYMNDVALGGGLSGDITTYSYGHFFKCVRALCLRAGHKLQQLMPRASTQPVPGSQGDAQFHDPQPAVRRDV